MKQTELIAVALAGLALLMIVKAKGKASAKAPNATTGTPGGTVAEIFNGAGSAFDNGWRYFSDGTSISPEGDYYFGGQKVYTAPVNQ